MLEAIGEFFMNAVRGLFFMIDNVVYSLISSAYELIIYLANVDLVSENSVLDGLIERIYLLLGIFMLFKLSFSMIQYLVDPNSFNDKSKGFGKLITNSMVSIVLLALTPFLFTKVYQLQEIILDSNVVSNLILGQKLDTYYSSSNSNGGTSRADEVRQMATDVQFTLFSAFYTLNTTDESSEEGQELAMCEPTKKYPTSNILGSRDMAMVRSGKCLDNFVEVSAEIMTNNGIELKDIFKYETNDVIFDDRDFSKLGGLVTWKLGTSYAINYTFIISTIVGGYLLFLLITFCIDIAARAIKLMFLEAVAPIAIISYMDPKESMGQGKLHNWLMETLKTFFSLFLRLAVIFLAMRLVQMLTSMIFYATDGNQITYYSDLSEPQGIMNIFVYVFLILGIFTFAKQVPKMIEGIFGIKMTGEMSLNPFKSIRENAGATAMLGGAAALGSTVLGVGSYLGQKGRATAKNISKIKDGRTWRETMKDANSRRDIGRNVASMGRGLFTGAGQMVTGTFRGVKAGASTGGKGGYVRAGLKQGGQSMWNIRRNEHTNFRDRAVNAYQEVTGAPTEAYKNKTEDATRKRISDMYDSMKKDAEREIVKSSYNGNVHADKYNQEMANKVKMAEAMKHATSPADALRYQQEMKKAEANAAAALKDFQDDTMTKMGAYDAYFKDATDLNRTYSEVDGFNGTRIDNMDSFRKLKDDTEAASANIANDRSRLAGDTLYEDDGQRAVRNWRDSH